MAPPDTVVGVTVNPRWWALNALASIPAAMPAISLGNWAGGTGAFRNSTPCQCGSSASAANGANSGSLLFLAWLINACRTDCAACTPPVPGLNWVPLSPAQLSVSAASTDSGLPANFNTSRVLLADQLLGQLSIVHTWLASVGLLGICTAPLLAGGTAASVLGSEATRNSWLD